MRVISLKISEKFKPFKIASVQNVWTQISEEQAVGEGTQGHGVRFWKTLGQITIENWKSLDFFPDQPLDFFSIKKLQKLWWLNHKLTTNRTCHTHKVVVRVYLWEWYLVLDAAPQEQRGHFILNCLQWPNRVNIGSTRTSALR